MASITRRQILEKFGDDCFIAVLLNTLAVAVLNNCGNDNEMRQRYIQQSNG
jgi:hypothetical protein